MATTIQISDDIREKLESMKIHKREALNEVIKRALEKVPVKIKANDLQKLKEISIPILQGYGVKKAAVFGSFARGDANEESDVDLLVQLKEGSSLFDLAHLKNELEEALGRDVDLISYKWIDEHIKERVLGERVVLYE
jgi:hypothetical protein